MPLKKELHHLLGHLDMFWRILFVKTRARGVFFFFLSHPVSGRPILSLRPSCIITTRVLKPHKYTLYLALEKQHRRRDGQGNGHLSHLHIFLWISGSRFRLSLQSQACKVFENDVIILLGVARSRIRVQLNEVGVDEYVSIAVLLATNCNGCYSTRC